LWQKQSHFNRVQKFFESSLERKVRSVLDKLCIEYVHPFWANAEGWKQKQYDFFIPDLNLLIEVDGTYWHSQQHNIDNDRYKDHLAKFLGKDLIRFPESTLTEDAIKSAIADYRKKRTR
jgi:very-short-patch-repair endonuclease